MSYVVPCITTDCSADARWRGLCSRCYGQAKRLIEKGETTWDELVGMGLAKPNVDQLFTAAFYAKRKSEHCPHCNEVVTDRGGVCVYCGKDMRNVQP